MALSPGSRLGPYEVVGLLGAGGMGEVHRARDPRLGREVAVKVLPEEVGRDADRLAGFEREARAVAALNHPNILTVHDVGSHEGTPYVVTELLEGETLREVLSRRMPSHRQALSLAIQAARGLEAAHAKGILHRDLKPENLFVTSDGRLKILDFGLAKLVSGETAGSQEATASSPSRPGELVGTVGYMSPEQVRGLPLDARSDLFSLGVVLYELLGGKHPFRRETAVATLTAILEHQPAPLPAVAPAVSPALGRIVSRCLEKDREDRIASAHDLAVVLEAVQAEPAGAFFVPSVEERSPYPGLSSFTEKDAALFFGREAEVEALWTRLRARRLLALIGPSGVGKTSFLRAGVVPARSEGWAALLCTPGASPFRSLGQALAPELASDPEALRMLVNVDDPAAALELASHWRKAHAETLLVVDQFEELFTLAPPEVQTAFAALLARLAREADLHVLLSMRDDFLIRCSEHPPLVPVFEALTPLAPLTGEALRRAVVEPAAKRGHAFEDEALVGEMLASVEGARGALPLVAFAVAQLWERRDREKRLLTRAAYQEIGGVAGALAQHAEATLERIGAERQPMVREVFRNLVTAEGTRAAADREELLSVFPERHAAEEVLGALIDARLLTSYEVAAGLAGEAKEATPAEEGPRHRIEIVHESLVKAWPRLVWWQAQDEEGARLRDQLRQAAHLWEEKGRSPDVLWSGTAFREFELWRERYPGGLTALEEAFARAMTERERRRARLRRTAAASVVVGLAAVAIAIGISREQTARARDRAVAEARRAEAGKLIALGQLQLDTYPTAALAYARKSLERFDTPEARRLAVQALWRGPVARILPLQGGGNLVAFSPDGRWVAASTPPDGDVHLFGEDGAPGPVLTSPRKGADGWLAFDARGDRLVTWAGSDLAVYSVPEGRALGVLDLGEGMHWVQPRAAPDGGLFTLTYGKDRFRVREWPHDGGTPTELGSMEVGPKTAYPTVDPTGTWLATYDLATGDFEFRRLRQLAAGRPKRLGAKLSEQLWAATSFAPSGDRLVTADKEGNIRLWSTAASRKEPLLALKAQDPDWADSIPRFDATGRRLSWASLVHGVVYMWDLDGPPEADPLVLHAPLAGSGGLLGASFHPGGGWLAEGGFGVEPAFWAVGLPYARVLHSPTGGIFFFAVSPDSRRLVGAGFGGLRLWVLQPRGRPERLALEGIWYLPLFDAGGRLYAAQWHGPGPPRTSAYLVPTDGSPPRLLTRFASSRIDAMALDREGRRLAVATGAADPPETPLVRILDLSTGAVRDFPVEAAPGAAPIRSLAFAADGALLSGGEGGVQSWNTETGERRTILAAGFAVISASADGRRLVVVAFKGRDVGPDSEIVTVDLDTGAHRTIRTHRSRVAALDPSGQILVSGGEDGAVRVGPATGEEPDLLLGHSSRVGCVGVTPDGRWVVSVAGNEVRLWPMPDVSKPPFHTLPYEELMARLGAMTNVQVAEDGSSPTGYKLEVGPFPGWKDMPPW